MYLQTHARLRTYHGNDENAGDEWCLDSLETNHEIKEKDEKYDQCCQLFLNTIEIEIEIEPNIQSLKSCSYKVESFNPSTNPIFIESVTLQKYDYSKNPLLQFFAGSLQFDLCPILRMDLRVQKRPRGKIGALKPGNCRMSSH